MKFTGQFQKKPAASSAPIPFSTGMFRSRPFPTPEAQRSPAATPDHEPLPRRNPDYNRIFGVQPKLTVGAPNDVYEQEADRVADQVMGMPDTAVQSFYGKSLRQDLSSASILPAIQCELVGEEEQATRENQETQTSQDQLQTEQEPSGEEDPVVQTKPLQLASNQDQKFNTNRNLESRINGSLGTGSPIPDETRSFMESRFRFDFSQVRIHADNESAQLSQELSAQAFTHKNDIYFGANKYSPHSNSGKRLLAHELSHVVQQTGGVPTNPVSNQTTLNRKCTTCEEEQGTLQRVTEVSNSSELVLQKEDINLPEVTITGSSDEAQANEKAHSNCLNEVTTSKDGCDDRAKVVCGIVSARLGPKWGVACSVAYGKACRSDAKRGKDYCDSKKQCLNEGNPSTSCPTSPYIIGSDPWNG